MKKIITRYAPSPTGELHLGGVRTALFCYLLAKNKNGKFIIRTEDTDENRNNSKYIYSHLSTLNKLEIIEDASVNKPDSKGPYLQSKRQQIYKKYVQELINQKKAYYCFCKKAVRSKVKDDIKIRESVLDYDYQKCYSLSSEETKKKLKSRLKYVIRFINKREGDVVFNDIVFKEIRIKSDTIFNFIIMKNNETPSYNFACVVDDYLMGITHVIRGAEHLSNTAKQIVLYKSLGFSLPQFAHVSLIVNEYGKKLSKREANNSINQLLNSGFCPQAIVNYIAFLGWQPDKTREIFSLVELEKLFDLCCLSKSPAVFDINKLKWFNRQYIKKMTEQEFIKYLQPLHAEIARLNQKALSYFYNYFQTRIDCHADLKKQIIQILEFHLPTKKSENLRNKYQKNILILKEHIENWLIKENHDLSNSTNAQNLIEYCKWKSEYQGKDLYVALRLILNNIHHGIALNNLILLLGRNEILRRIEMNV